MGSDRAAFISDPCCSRTWNRGKLLNIYQLQFHLQEGEITIPSIRSAVGHRSNGVHNDCTGSRSWWPLPAGAGTKTSITDPWLGLHPHTETRLGRKVIKEHPRIKASLAEPCGWKLSDFSCLWPCDLCKVWTWRETPHMCRILHIPAYKQLESFHSLIMSPGHTWACRPQGRMPVVIHALWWPSRGDRCLLHTLCQWGPAVLLWPLRLLPSCQKLPHSITVTETESSRQEPGPSRAANIEEGRMGDREKQISCYMDWAARSSFCWR